jgi:hypothetical protein
MGHAEGEGRIFLPPQLHHRVLPRHLPVGVAGERLHISRAHLAVSLVTWVGSFGLPGVRPF